MFLGSYVDPVPRRSWISCSLKTAKAYQTGPATAKSLRHWTQAFIADRHVLPYTAVRPWQQSLLEHCPDLKTTIEEHLQSIGLYVRAMDIVQFMAEPANLLRFGLTKPVSLSTAQAWMRLLEYRWIKVPSGQYVDGHEHADVIRYRQNTFLPAMAKMNDHARIWDKDGSEAVNTPAVPSASVPPLHATTAPGPSSGTPPSPHPLPSSPDPPSSSLSPPVSPESSRTSSPVHCVVYWFHDESVFYANDRQKTRWVHKSGKAVPHAKGEGASLMAADFVSADYGWLRSLDGKEST